LFTDILSRFELDVATGQHSPGLMHGRSGTAIIFHLLGKHTGDMKYDRHLQELLKNISEDIRSTTDVHFENGLSGIGWTMEWLLQNGLSQTEKAIEITNYTDNEIYTSILFAEDEQISLTNGTPGKLSYFLKRGQDKKATPDNLLYIFMQRSIIELTDDLDNRLCFDNSTIFNTNNNLPSEVPISNTPINNTDLANLLRLLCKIDSINGLVTQKLLSMLISGAKKILQHIDELHSDEIDHTTKLHLLHLGISYLNTMKTLNKIPEQEQAQHYLKKLLHYENTVGTNNKPNELLLLQLKIYTLLSTYTTTFHYREKATEILARILQSALPSSNYNGTGTLMLCYLCINNPSLLSDWHELILI